MKMKHESQTAAEGGQGGQGGQYHNVEIFENEGGGVEQNRTCLDGP